MSYAWIIDRDNVECDDAYRCVGLCGPMNADSALVAALKKGAGQHFKMYDDDGELYYEGRLLVSPGDQDCEVEFAPLSDFGMPNSGATEIHYLTSGKWSRL